MLTDAAPQAGLAPPSPALSIAVLGPVRASVRGQEVPIRSRKGRAVLAYLALEEAGRETRERLVGLLWSEIEEAKARNSLRQVVHELRTALAEAGCESLRFERSVLAIDHAGLEVDAQRLLDQVEAGEVPPLLLDAPRLHERLLQDLDDLDEPFQVWLRARRQAFLDRLVRQLERLLRRDAPSARASRAAAATAVLQLDPTHEEACRTLMRARAEEGDSVGAMRAYEQLWNVLGDEYDTEPAPATQQLIADIKTGRIGPAAAPEEDEALPLPALPRTQALPPRIALLVGRFEMNGVPPERAHLVDGFRYDLISRLVRFREWFVVDGSAPPAGPTAARVSAYYRISATAYQAGNRVSMVLILAEQESGILVWSERLGLELDNWFEAQSNVVRRIAIALNTQISVARLTRVAVEHDLSLEGYDRWLRCQSFLLQFRPEQWDRAFGMLEEMTARAPGFAPAWSNLAQLDNVAHITRPGIWRDRARERRALEHARRAVRADPNDGRSQLCLAWSLIMMGAYDQAGVPLRLALELNPDDSWLLVSASQIHTFLGDQEASAPLAQQSLEATLVPTRAHWGFQAANAFFAGDDEGTLAACDLAEDTIRTSQGYRAAALYHLGRQREAEAAAERFARAVREAWLPGRTPTDAEIARWFLHLFPLRRPMDWERLRAGIAGAGLPTRGCAHGAWYIEETTAGAAAAG